MAQHGTVSIYAYIYKYTYKYLNIYILFPSCSCGQSLFFKLGSSSRGLGAGSSCTVYLLFLGLHSSTHQSQMLLLGTAGATCLAWVPAPSAPAITGTTETFTIHIVSSSSQEDVVFPSGSSNPSVLTTFPLFVSFRLHFSSPNDTPILLLYIMVESPAAPPFLEDSEMEPAADWPTSVLLSHNWECAGARHRHVVRWLNNSW